MLQHPAAGTPLCCACALFLLSSYPPPVYAKESDRDNMVASTSVSLGLALLAGVPAGAFVQGDEHLSPRDMFLPALVMHDTSTLDYLAVGRAIKCEAAQSLPHHALRPGHGFVLPPF